MLKSRNRSDLPEIMNSMKIRGRGGAVLTDSSRKTYNTINTHKTTYFSFCEGESHEIWQE